MRHYDSPAAMVRMKRSSQSLTWPSSVGATTTELFTLPAIKIQPVETLTGKAFHSSPLSIIYHIHNETL
eukprot:scaffold131539_cov43-Cyclotella_meneghiniana.AAC.5